MRIFGVDPGYAITGWGLVEATGRSGAIFRAESYGAITTEAGVEMPQRLAHLGDSFAALLREWRPDLVVCEKLYFGKNCTTALGVSEARGVLLAEVGRESLPFLELSPSTIKQSITGSGRAGKRDVTQMVERLLGLSEPVRPDDTADALACAVSGYFAARSADIAAQLKEARR